MPGPSPLSAKDIMRTQLVTASPGQRLAEVRHQLLEAHISGMPVIAEGRLVGIISRSDLGRIEDLFEQLDGEVTDQGEWLSEQADGFQHAPERDYHGFRQRLSDLRVRDAMRTQVITCRPETPVAEVAGEMVRHHVHRVIVVEGDRPVGIVSSLDLARLVADGRT